MSTCSTPATKSSGQHRTMTVDLFYIDLSTCDRCQGADHALQEALKEVAPILASIGVKVDLNSRLIQSRQEAEAVRLVSSPTIRIDGHDIQAAPKESSCAACSSLTSQGAVDCREWQWRGQTYNAPPKEMIVEALLRAALDEPRMETPEGEFHLPANLVSFFENRRAPTPSACGCG